MARTEWVTISFFLFVKMPKTTVGAIQKHLDNSISLMQPDWLLRAASPFQGFVRLELPVVISELLPVIESAC